MDTRLLVKRLSRSSDRLFTRPAGVTVLIYHRIAGGSDSEVDLPFEQFERHLAHLAEHCTVVSLDDAVAHLALTSSPAGPAAAGPVGATNAARDSRVVITFDDGTADFVDHAVPALVRHGLPATLYAATKFIDEQTEFPWGAPPASWSGLREAVETGLITVGSHTHSHWLLDRLDPAAIADDLDRSIELIGAHLTHAPRHFAYPKAVPGSTQAEIAVRRRFVSAALAASRVNQPGRTDLHRLWRTPVQRSDGFEFFAAKAQGGLRMEGALRALAARVKYRGASR